MFPSIDLFCLQVGVLMSCSPPSNTLKYVAHWVLPVSSVCLAVKILSILYIVSSWRQKLYVPMACTCCDGESWLRPFSASLRAKCGMKVAQFINTLSPGLCKFWSLKYHLHLYEGCHLSVCAAHGWKKRGSFQAYGKKCIWVTKLQRRNLERLSPIPLLKQVQ